ncbi:MAG: hypothetical protein JSW47_07310 [Phycisphaerales bacterium]|nr:MAG: hypothetical protein JSW47_07310 [Phycisphaerales bacterium]
MANEIHIDYAAGNTLYAVIRDVQGKVWYPANQVFESWGANERDADDYDIVMVDKSGSRYTGSFDSNVPAGRYSVQIFLQAGANPADTDVVVGGTPVRWSGTGQITTDKVLVNKAVQEKSTGAIQYYDDDDQTILLTLMPNDTQTEITRTVS